MQSKVGQVLYLTGAGVLCACPLVHNPYGGESVGGSETAGEEHVSSSDDHDPGDGDGEPGNGDGEPGDGDMPNGACNDTSCNKIDMLFVVDGSLSMRYDSAVPSPSLSPRLPGVHAVRASRPDTAASNAVRPVFMGVLRMMVSEGRRWCGWFR